MRGSSNRSFGLVLASAFLLAGGWPLFHRQSIRGWALGIGVGLLLIALARPHVLAPLNRLWLRLGLRLQRLVSPVILGLLFFVTVTPIGILMRLVGKNPLRLGFDREATSYWIDRRPPGPAPDTMRNQF
ncbi:MAG TPA: SxtJ family membrane protein [Candidatus Methylomirabilis sp.]|nr:SxtJ family membrane protein [Candidatus Methylomirabilis sp.]